LSAPAKSLHTRLSRGLVLLALGTGVGALAFGNPVLLALAATLAALLHASRAGWPGTGEVDLALASPRAHRGGAAVLSMTARTPAKGPAVYWVHADLPTAMPLERGSNLGVTGPGASFAERLVLRCPKRGPFTFPGATLTAVHPHLLAPITRIAASAPVELVVDPRVRALRGAKGIRGRAKQPMGEDRGMRGGGSIDFREVREYERGDPLKNVNWKATAKRSIRELELMVNEFEPEARKNVWFFLDMSTRMEVGTTVDNAFEDAIEATLALAQHFLSRGHRVGGTTFNGPTPLVFYPDSGSRQQLTIARALAHATPAPAEEGLPAAVERVRGFLTRERPTVFVVTRPELDPEGLALGTKRIRLFATGHRAQPVFVLAPIPAPASPAEAFGQALYSLEARARVGALPGVRVLHLRRGVLSLHRALAKGVLSR
jgi:uncharacterized protein (DUF58 family)